MQETIDKRLLAPERRHERPADETALGFGDIYADHLFRMDYHDGAWRRPRIEPFGPLSLSPASMCLHYGQEIFEGLKCFRRSDGSLALFRPKDNFARFSNSAKRLCIPPPDEDLALAALKELLAVDQAWVPRARGASLYIRPFIIAVEPHLGVRPAKDYIFLIITGPVGAYYAASLLGAEEAHRLGFSQTLWLDANEHKYVEEVGSMNMFFVLDDELLTPPLSDSVLSGITRDSVLTLARSWGLKAAERPLALEELLAAGQAGRLREAFGCGTACVISPVGRFSYLGRETLVGDGGVGPLTQRLYDELLGLQYGDRPDPFGWVTPLP